MQSAVILETAPIIKYQKKPERLLKENAPLDDTKA